MRAPIQRPNLSCREIDGQTIIVDLNGKRMFHGLNETAALLFKNCDGTQDIESLVKIMMDSYQVDSEMAKADTAEILEQFEDLELISYD